MENNAMSFVEEFFEIAKRIEQWMKFRQNLQKYLMNIYFSPQNKLGRDWAPDDNLYLLDMETAYVPLSLVKEGWNSEILELEGVIARDTRLVIQGGPGSGKSTLVRYIMLLMTRALLSTSGQKLVFGAPPLFPIEVNLGKIDSGFELEEYIEKRTKGLLPEEVKKKIKGGHILFVFDGLDEIADLKQREIILRQIGEMSGENSSGKKTNLFLITTRSAGYSHRILAGFDFSLYTLQALTHLQQREMIAKYYQCWALKKIPLPPGFSTPRDLANHLMEQMDKNQKEKTNPKPSFDRLRNNPLMLSQIALMQYIGRNIPTVKRELYEICILQLIKRHVGSGVQATNILPKNINDALIFLGGMAFLLHQVKETDWISFEQSQSILKELKKTFPELEIEESQILSILEVAVENWGILLVGLRNSDGKNIYKFANLSFQEYLVANLIHKSPKQKRYWDLVSKKQYLHVDWTWWQEVAMMYSGMPEQNELPSDKVVDELLKANNVKQNWVNAGYCMLNSQNPARVRRRKEIIEHLKHQVLEFIENDSKDALEVLIQIEPDGIKHVLDSIYGQSDVVSFNNGRFLDLVTSINEPISRQILRDALIDILQKKSKYVEPPDEEILVKISVVLGNLGDTRLGQFCRIDGNGFQSSSFEIGQYPVTNSEYYAYIEDVNLPLPLSWGGSVPLGLANHPVVSVSYEDVNAYCKWLSKKQKQVCRLPTEKEWCLMSREGKRDREWSYPWGAELKVSCLNSRSKYVNSTKTTPVGLFWEGRTPLLGICDVLGNVWEWTSTHKRGSHVIKGLAWDSMDVTNGVNCTEFIRRHERRDNIGFRVLREV